jgi:site-specific DNA-methyltransferase (adenine-specific)
MNWEVKQGDCREVMATLDAESVDAIVSDPPYGLSFMGKGWDHSVPSVEFWEAALRVAKPGAHLLAFGGTRLFHRLAVAIEDAGWEIRDTLSWIYGSGFPKSHNGDWGGTALKPAWEPIIMARKPLIGTVAANFEKHGTGGLNIDGCRVGTESTITRRNGNSGSHGRYGVDNRVFTRENPPGRWPANLIHDGSEEVVAGFPETKSGKPCGMKTGGQGNAFGKFAGGIPVTGIGDLGSAARFFYCAKASKADRDEGLEGFDLAHPSQITGRKIGSAGAKAGGYAGTTETPKRNVHPTVKPTDLMAYLCRLVTPKGGIVLDPFCGSGSTGKAAVREGFNFIGIELDPEYANIARARIEHETTKAELCA